MTSEKEKTIYGLNPDFVLIKWIMIIILVLAGFIISIYCVTAYKLTTDTIDELISSVYGYDLIVISFSGSGFLVNRSLTKSLPKNKDNTVYYDVYAIIPIQRNYLAKQQFRYWKYTAIFAGIALTITNIIYFFNPVLKQIPGYYVFITCTLSFAIICDFAARFHRKKWGEIGKTLFVLIYLITISLNTLAIWGLRYAKTFVINFMKFKVLKPFAGIPMLILSLALFPVILFVYNRYTGKGRKFSAWYSN